MGRNRNAKGAGPGRAMSRGEFLGVGAAAAGGLGAAHGASLGAPALDATPTEAAGDLQCEPTTCPPSQLTWCIPSGVLNSLWCDFLPRLVGLRWLRAVMQPADFHSRYGAPPPELLHRGMGALGIEALLDWLKVRMSGAASTGAALPPCEGAPSSLRGRLDMVIEFLAEHRNRFGRPFPLVIAGSGGFDFLLSDWGIEMFIPDPPAGPTDEDQAHELLRYYALRQTGRPSLGIPSYLAHTSLLSVDAPVGPSQVEVHPISLLGTLGLDPECGEVQRLLRRWGVILNPTLLAQIAAVKVEFERGELRGPPPRIQLIPRQAFRMTFDEYVCAMRPFRCWQVEGTVYRGMALELPRIVATAWMEQVPAQPGCTQSYSTRLTDPGNDGLRGIFMERMETVLPRHDRMVFKVGAPAPHPPPPRWRDDDMMITNQGFYFPDPGAPPSLTGMLQEIAEGRAGNPVFTDSKRPEREG